MQTEVFRAVCAVKAKKAAYAAALHTRNRSMLSLSAKFHSEPFVLITTMSTDFASLSCKEILSA